ncbi:MAG: peptidylprolyl isomerase [Lysobacteraceae bacterium]
MKLIHVVASLMFVLPTLSNAQQAQPKVLLDTTQGPIILELDNERAPRTTANFLAYVDDGSFNDMIVQRVVKNFVVQSGSLKSNGTAIPSKGAIASERGNGLSNTYGRIAMALSSTITGQTNVNSAASAFYINTGNNSSNLDANFTAFGQVVYGMNTLATLNNTPVFSGSDQPVLFPVVRRAVRVDGFPILDVHTGAWFDPAKSGRGFALEISRASGGSAQPLAIVNWYDYSEGKQIWLNGAIPFQWGDSSVTVPMQITSGAQFGNAFAPEQVESDLEWGTLTIRFSDCHHGEFSFQSKLGNATYQLTRITEPTHIQCLDD